MRKERNFDPAGVRRIRADSVRETRDGEPWLRSILNALRVGTPFLVIVNNPSDADTDRRQMDDLLAEIAVLQSKIVNQTERGKEINALKDEVGYPPYTFSQVDSFYPGSAISLAQKWEDEGMATLIQMPIYPTEDGEDGRMAVLYGVGDLEDLSHLESTFLDYFTPSRYSKSFASAACDKNGQIPTTRFFVQWQLFPNEAAHALGISEDSSQFDEIMDRLEEQSKALRETQNIARNGVVKKKGARHQGVKVLDKFKS